MGAIFQLAFHQCLCSVVFRPQVQGSRHVASKLNYHLFICCVDYALMYDTMYALITEYDNHRHLFRLFCLFSHVAAMILV